MVLSKRVLKSTRVFKILFDFYNCCSGALGLLFLYDLRSLFINEDVNLKRKLSEKGFHLSIVNHPSILFNLPRAYKKKNNILFFNLKINYLFFCFANGVINSSQNVKLMKLIGLSEAFISSTDIIRRETEKLVQYSIPSKAERKKNIVVYTVLTGNYDVIHEILYKERDVDYILFTNNKAIKSTTWNVLYLDSSLDNLLLSREVKIKSYKYINEKYDYSIYVDANVIIYGEISLLLSYLNSEIDFAVTKHAYRFTIIDEIKANVAYKGVDYVKAMVQYSGYLKEGFRDDLGLGECTILIRKEKDNLLKELMDEWWKEFSIGIHRDQLSLMPCIFRKDYNRYYLIDGFVWHNQFCITGKHK